MNYRKESQKDANAIQFEVITEMLRSYSSSSFHVHDSGLNVELALALAKQGVGRVTYTSPWRSAFPSSMQTEIGEGIPQIERVSSLAEVRNETDCFVFPDIYFASDQLELQDAGKRVFGSRDADELERFRNDAKKHFEKLGIPQSPWCLIKGVKKLRSFLEGNDEKYWIKVDDTRADTETFSVEGYELFKGRIDELEFKLGPKAEIMKFTVEDDDPDSLDLAIDTHVIDGQYPSVALLGTEEKGELYVGVVKPWNEMPLKLLDIYDRLRPTLKEYEDRNFISLESRVKGTRINLGDPCMRAGSPPGELQYKMIKNLPDIFWYGAEGKMVDPEYDGKYGVEVCVESAWADKNPLMVEFPEKYRDNIKFRYLSQFDGKTWILPQEVGPRVAAIVSCGNSLDDCFEEVQEISKQIRGINIETFVHAIPMMKEKLKIFKQWDILF
jgi:hypothetical protein